MITYNSNNHKKTKEKGKMTRKGEQIALSTKHIFPEIFATEIDSTSIHPSILRLLEILCLSLATIISLFLINYLLYLFPPHCTDN